jgi:hypothetical protein
MGAGIYFGTRCGRNSAQPHDQNFNSSKWIDIVTGRAVQMHEDELNHLIGYLTCSRPETPVANLIIGHNTWGQI